MGQYSDWVNSQSGQTPASNDGTDNIPFFGAIPKSSIDYVYNGSQGDTSYNPGTKRYTYDLGAAPTLSSTSGVTNATPYDGSISPEGARINMLAMQSFLGSGPAQMSYSDALAQAGSMLNPKFDQQRDTMAADFSKQKYKEDQILGARYGGSSVLRGGTRQSAQDNLNQSQNSAITQLENSRTQAISQEAYNILNTANTQSQNTWQAKLNALNDAIKLQDQEQQNAINNARNTKLDNQTSYDKWQNQQNIEDDKTYRDKVYDEDIKNTPEYKELVLKGMSEKNALEEAQALKAGRSSSSSSSSGGDASNNFLTIADSDATKQNAQDAGMTVPQYIEAMMRQGGASEKEINQMYETLTAKSRTSFIDKTQKGYDDYQKYLNDNAKNQKLYDEAAAYNPEQFESDVDYYSEQNKDSGMTRAKAAEIVRDYYNRNGKKQ